MIIQKFPRSEKEMFQLDYMPVNRGKFLDFVFAVYVLARLAIPLFGISEGKKTKN